MSRVDLRGQGFRTNLTGQGFRNKLVTGEFHCLILKLLSPPLCIKFHLGRYCCYLPFFVTYKSISAISWDPNNLETFQQTRVVQKSKTAAFSNSNCGFNPKTSAMRQTLFLMKNFFLMSQTLKKKKYGDQYLVLNLMPECTKWHFRASRFLNFPGEHAPRPP